MANKEFKNHQAKRVAVGKRASAIGILVNLMLALCKIIAGIISGSVSVMADGLNNLSDAGSGMVSYFSMHYAQKPEDVEHPFGHARIEYIGSLAVGMIILIIGYDLFRSSIETIIHPKNVQFSTLVIVLTAISIPAKIVLGRFYKRTGKQYQASTLIAAAKDSFNDVMVSSAVVMGMLIYQYFKITVDGYLGLAIALVVLWNAITVIKDTVSSLLGTKPDPFLGKEILRIIKEYPEISDVHDFVLHDYGPGRSMASIHAEVPADGKILEIHEIIDQAEQRIKNELGIPICIHMDPVVQETSQEEVYHEIQTFLRQYSPPIKMHDFRMVPGKSSVKLIFDIEIPADFHGEDHLIAQLKDHVRSFDERYQCIIDVDRNFFEKTE